MQAQHNNKVVELHSQGFGKHYVPAVQAVTSYWAAVFPQPAVAVLSFVIERTLRWGKIRESISYRHFLEGVYSRDGVLVQPRIRIARRNLPKAVRFLETLGVLTVVRASSTQRGFESNLFEIDFNLVIQRDTSMLKTPKRLKNALVSDGHYPSVPGTLPLCLRDTLNTQKNKSHKDKSHKHPGTKKQVPGLGPDSSPEEIVSAVHKHHAARREELSASFRMSPTNLRAVWVKAMQRNYEHVPLVHMTEKSYGIFKKSANLNFKDTQKLPAFITWCVDNWPALRGGKLSWLNKKKESMPLVPDLDVLGRLLRVFAKAYAEHCAGEDINEKRKVGDSGKIVEAKLGAALRDADYHKKQAAALAAQVERLRMHGGAGRIREKVVPISRAAIKQAEEIYNDSEDIGEWKEN